MKNEINFLILGMILVGSAFVSATDISTSSYSVNSTHLGVSGAGNISTTNYQARDTITYQQTGGSWNTLSYLFNLGWFDVIKKLFSEVSINSTTTSPSAVINGSSVSLYISALNAESVWANLTQPNGFSKIISLTNNANTTYTNTTQLGTYNVIFYANDSSGNFVNTIETFTVALPVNVTINVDISIAADVSSSVIARVLVAGTNEVLSTTEINGSKSLLLPNVPVDVSFETSFDNDTSLTILFNFNLSESVGGSINFGNIRVDPFLLIYGVTTNFSFTSAQVIVSYQNASFANKDNLQFHRCENYTVDTGTCISGFNDVTSDATTTHDKTNDKFIYNTTSFSGFGIREVTPSTPSSGGGTASTGGGAGCMVGYTFDTDAGKCVKAEEGIPSQLFDITFSLDDKLIQSSDELSAVVTFESFGTEPTLVNLTFIILDKNGNEYAVDKDFIVVTTEEVFRKKFENLNLPEGKYTLILETLYNVDVFDEFRQKFEIGEERSGIGKVINWIAEWKWYFIGIIIVILITGLTWYLIKRGKKKVRENKTKGSFIEPKVKKLLSERGKS